MSDETKVRIIDLGIAAIRILQDPSTKTIAEYSDLIRAECNAELTALRQQVADLRAACEKADVALNVLKEKYIEAEGAWVLTDFFAAADNDSHWMHTIIAAEQALAATQPQEVQP